VVYFYMFCSQSMGDTGISRKLNLPTSVLPHGTCDIKMASGSAVNEECECI
jgi:hypothetical protein